MRCTDCKIVKNSLYELFADLLPTSSWQHRCVCRDVLSPAGCWFIWAACVTAHLATQVTTRWQSAIVLCCETGPLSFYLTFTLDFWFSCSYSSELILLWLFHFCILQAIINCARGLLMSSVSFNTNRCRSQSLFNAYWCLGLAQLCPLLLLQWM